MKHRLALDDAVKEPGGVWSLVGERLTCVEAGGDGPAVVLVPSEQVTTTAVDLPLPTRARRVAALPFALEDSLAEPLDQVHLALGAELSPRRHIAGAVRHTLMRDWVERIEAEGLSRAALLPDALTLPLPPAGCWAVAALGGRVLVRTDEGVGFALPAALFAAAWSAAGSPGCLSYGDALPEGVIVLADEGAARPATPALDLRQGAYAPRRRPLPAIWRRLGLVVLGGLCAHGAIAAADLVALRHVAAERRTATRALVAQLAPDAVIGDDVASDATALLPVGNGGASSGFLPLLVRTTVAMQPLGGGAIVRGLSYSEGDRALTLQVESADMAGLQRVTQALAAAGLTPTSGAATTDEGRANGEIIVHPGGA